MKERILVTSALPYANGPLHIGHAIGAYVPADVYSRYKRMSGAEVLFVCGTDEHGTPIVVAAEKEGVTPRQIVDKYHARIREDFEKLEISFDHFSRTTIPIHYKESQDFFLRMLNNGYVYKKAVERPYCPKCKRFLPDRFVKGTCPKCGAKDERGDQCEKCGKQLEPHELITPYCAICRTTPVQKSTEHWFFKLSEVSNKLWEWIEKNRHWPDNARNFALGWIKEGLEDRAITRDIEWGVPVPVAGAEGKVLYVWFDAPIGYVSITKEWAEKNGKPEEWKKYWQEECRIVHFIGKDNIPFHTIIWPGMIIARGGYNLPYQVASNEFLTLQGQKMSTSRGWVVWLYEFLEKYPADTLRYSLLISNPEAHDADFSWEEYQSRVNGELADVLGNFVQRVLSFTTRYLDGKVPPQHVLNARDIQLLEDIKKTTDGMGGCLDKFRLQKALKELMGLAQKGNVYFNECAPWKGLKGGNMQETEQSINLCINLVRSLSILSSPFMPSTAEKIWRTLNLEGSAHGQEWKSAKEMGVKAGHKIREPEILFKKIEDRQIKEEMEKLNARLGGKSVESEKIKREEFDRLDLRVGTVIAAEKVPKSDRLLKLTVDIGEKRALVAGVGHKYAPEEMVGKQVIVLANLEPKEFKKSNLVSEGMILAAEDGEELVVLTTDKEIKPGSKIG